MAAPVWDPVLSRRLVKHKVNGVTDSNPLRSALFTGAAHLGDVFLGPGLGPGSGRRTGSEWVTRWISELRSRKPPHSASELRSELVEEKS